MSSALAEYRPAEHENPAQWVRRVFRTFRRSRPFYGGLLAMIAGVPIMYFPYAKLSLSGMTVQMATTGGAGSLIIGVLLIVLGLTAWFQPAVRFFAGVATSLLTLVSIPVSNLSGFGLALLPGLIGGGLMLAWAPNRPEDAEAGTAESTVAESTVAEPLAQAGTAATLVKSGPAAPTAADTSAEGATAPLPVVPAQAEPPAPGADPAAAEAGVPSRQTGDQKEAR
ncbi:DUF6114 domain-containing protein [Kitasatospora sp. NPDC059327]|uniref:DUF6114 domain-containing protein n=1 Tax=Kitasatospora sp. NPDC059327 TaxID=3346803 RepID=UPI0036A59B38